jgi:hypothetical protein
MAGLKPGRFHCSGHSPSASAVTFANALEAFIQERPGGFRQRSRPARLRTRFRMPFGRLFPGIVFRHVVALQCCTTTFSARECSAPRSVMSPDLGFYGNTIIVAKSPSAVPGDIDAAYNATRNSLDKITMPMMITARLIQAFLSASRSCSEFAIVTSITRLRLTAA